MVWKHFPSFKQLPLSSMAAGLYPTSIPDYILPNWRS